MKKTILKIVLPVVLISLCLMPLMYSAVATTPTGKIYFTWAPGGSAWFVHPGGIFGRVIVWAANMISSSYGPFMLVYLDYAYAVGTGSNAVHNFVDHWYTTDLDAADKYAALTVAVYSDAKDVYSWDVTLAAITMTQPNPNDFQFTVSYTDSNGNPVTFSVEYSADTSHPIESQPVAGVVSQNLFLGTRDFRPLASVTVTGQLSVGTWYKLPSGPDYSLSFRYVQTELYDPCLLSVC